MGLPFLDAGDAVGRGDHLAARRRHIFLDQEPDLPAIVDHQHPPLYGGYGIGAGLILRVHLLRRFRMEASIRSTSLASATRSESSTRGARSLMGRPTSVSSRLIRRTVAGVKRRMRRSESKNRVAMSVLASRFVRSLVMASSSSTLSCN